MNTVFCNSSKNTTFATMMSYTLKFQQTELVTYLNASKKHLVVHDTLYFGFLRYYTLEFQ